MSLGDVGQEQYGRYVIKSAKLSGTWQARAFRGARVIVTKAGAERLDALSSVKIELDLLDSIEFSGRESDGIPSARSYAEAFVRLEPIPDGHRAMLQAHLEAVDNLISATRLSVAAGYANWSAANLQYGKLGRRLAEDLNYKPLSRPDGSSIWTCALAKAPGADDDLDDSQLYDALERHLAAPHFEWLMRPQVVGALRSLGYK